MARINFEDCWWTDPRRSLLIKKLGSEELADGTIVKAWRLAQEFWKTDMGLVPADLFETLPAFQQIIDSKLAEYRETVDGRSVYVRGSSAYLDWVREKREQAAAAGKRSAEARAKKNGTAQPPGGRGHQNATTLNKEPNDNRTEFNGTEPSGSYSGSYSDSKKEEELRIEGSNEPSTTPSDKSPGAVVRRLERPSLSADLRPETEAELVAGLPAKAKARWAELYADETFIRREILRCFGWYENNPERKPKTVRGWVRAVGSWFERNWPKHTKTIKANNAVGYSEAELNDILGGGE